MPGLLIVNHAISEGGVERFLSGLIQGMLGRPGIEDWDITVLVPERDNRTDRMRELDGIATPNLQVRRMRDLWTRELYRRLYHPERLLGVPGTVRMQRLIWRWLVNREPGLLRMPEREIGVRLWLEYYCRKGGFDVVYFPYPYAMEPPVIPNPIVCTPHDLAFRRPDTFEDPAVRAHKENEIVRWLSASAAVVVSSEFIAGEIRECYPQFTDKVNVVRPGIPAGNREPAAADLAECLRTFGLPSEFLLTVGWILPRKNQKVIFQALGELRREGIDIPLVLVGPNSRQLRIDGDNPAHDYVREILELAEEMGLRHGSDFIALGWVSDFELECLYRTATALIASSLYEAGSFPAKEAFKAGCPVILSRMPAHMENLEMVGGNAWVFEPGDHEGLADTVKRILAAPDRAREIAENARRIACETFSWDKTARGYMSVFEKASGERREWSILPVAGSKMRRREGDDRRLKVCVAAETIPSTGAGLGYFLLSGLRNLALAEPDWRFKVIATSTFRELFELGLPNVEAIAWDGGKLFEYTSLLLRRFHIDDPEKKSLAIGSIVPSRRLRANWGSIRDLWATIGEADAVWVPHFAVTSGAGRMSLSRNLAPVKSPVLLTIHDVHPAFFPEDWTPESLFYYRNEFIPFAENSASIITHSAYQKRAIVETMGLEEGKIGVVHCPPIIDTVTLLQYYKPSEIEGFLKKNDIARPFALYTGSTSHTHKNHVRLILAWAELKKRLAEKCPTLVCTHKGYLWPSLRSLIASLGVEDKVVFTGNVSTPELAMLYRSCALVIVPTLYEGGGSGPVAEALVAGKPVLCSRIPQIEEQLEAYGCRAQMFSPLEIGSIAAAAESAFQRLDVLEKEAGRQKSILLEKISMLWGRWAIFYAGRIRSICSTGTSSREEHIHG